MKMDRTIYNSSKYLYNYYSQSRRNAANVYKSTGIKDNYKVSYDKLKSNTQKNNAQMIDKKEDKIDSNLFPDSSNTSKASKQQFTQKKSDSASLTLKETDKNTSNSLDPFLTLKKLYEISTNAKKT